MIVCFFHFCLRFCRKIQRVFDFRATRTECRVSAVRKNCNANETVSSSDLIQGSFGVKMNVNLNVRTNPVGQKFGQAMVR